ncbi:MAG: diphosphatase [Clostridiales bacterium]|jgi:NAD+ diphosphatase|nr:diphosphatase [Clostridiales bacterium]
MFKESIYNRYKPGINPSYEGEGAWWFIFCDDKLLVRSTEEGLKIPFLGNMDKIGIRPIRSQYLGTFAEQPCFSVEVQSGIAAPDGMEFRELRSLLGQIDDDIFLVAGRAIQIVDWDRSHQFCGRCGAPTDTKLDERAKACPKCGLLFYPRLSPAVIVAIVKEGKLLLAHNKRSKPNWYSVIAGFVEPGETFEECVQREVMEEVGLKVKNINYFGSQPWPFPNSLMVAFTAEYESGEIKVDGYEITDAGWYTPDTFPDTPGKTAIAGHLITWYKENYI